jgi:hypothetical protein
MSNITQARNELSALLTPIAPVRTGRAALETTSATLPIITLWNTGDSPAQDQGYSAVAYTRSLTLEYKATATAAYDDALDTVLHRIRAALKPPVNGSILPSALALRETSARFFVPDFSQGGGDLAVLQLTFEIDYLEIL